MGEKMERLEARVSSLFDAIKHGDDEHEQWLRKAIVDHFAGREVERPKGSGNREIIEQQQARIAGLEADLATQIQIGVTDAEEMDRLAEHAEAAEAALSEAELREAELVGARDTILRLVEEQINDEALWCEAQYISEAHIQQELRRLHEAIEGITSEEHALRILGAIKVTSHD